MPIAYQSMTSVFFFVPSILIVTYLHDVPEDNNEHQNDEQRNKHEWIQVYPAKLHRFLTDTETKQNVDGSVPIDNQEERYERHNYAYYNAHAVEILHSSCGLKRSVSKGKSGAPNDVDAVHEHPAH